LYNWYAVKTGKLAPKGWHVATDLDWTTLTNYLGGKVDGNEIKGVGGKLKEADTTHWKGPNTGATNETGFTALPGGCFDRPYEWNMNHDTHNMRLNGYWWTSTQIYPTSAWYRCLRYNSNSLFRIYEPLNEGYSVRCVKDKIY
jgi:uncharacterized protein (TIGR02145 family)